MGLNDAAIAEIMVSKKDRKWGEGAPHRTWPAAVDLDPFVFRNNTEATLLCNYAKGQREVSRFSRERNKI